MAVDLTPTLAGVYINAASVCIHYGGMHACVSGSCVSLRPQPKLN